MLRYSGLRIGDCVGLKRDTWMAIEEVAILLGHAITAKYYAHFVKARRERLEERVRELWS